MAAIREFCVDQNLVGLEDKSLSLNELLEENFELGALFLAEECDDRGQSGLELAQQIHKKRPDLPIFLRREQNSKLDQMTNETKLAIAGSYHLEDMAALSESVQEFIFNNEFPCKFVRGVQGLTIAALEAEVKGIEVIPEVPYVAKEYRLQGDLSSYTALNGQWCRGLMEIQISNDSVQQLIGAGKTNLMVEGEVGAKDINGWLSDISNMTWGSFKSYFLTIDVAEEHSRAMDIAIPVIANFRDGTVSTGSSMPQICFNYLLVDTETKLPDIRLTQKLLFHLFWVPEAIADIDIVFELAESEEVVFF